MVVFVVQAWPCDCSLCGCLRQAQPRMAASGLVSGLPATQRRTCIWWHGTFVGYVALHCGVGACASWLMKCRRFRGASGCPFQGVPMFRGVARIRDLSFRGLPLSDSVLGCCFGHPFLLFVGVPLRGFIAGAWRGTRGLSTCAQPRITQNAWPDGVVYTFQPRST